MVMLMHKTRQGTVEEKATISVTAHKPVNVVVEYTNTAPPDGDDENGEGRLSQPALMRGVVSPCLLVHQWWPDPSSSDLAGAKRLTPIKQLKQP